MTKHGSMSTITPEIIRCTARVLLEKNIPMFISISNLDDPICEMNEIMTHLTPRFRKAQISKNITVVSYAKHSVSGHGKVSFRMVGNRDEVREKLECIAGGNSE